MYNSLLDIILEAAARFPDRVAHRWREKSATLSRSYAELGLLSRHLIAGFAELGIARGDHVGFFVNNRSEWLATDFALMALGAVSVPRGSDTAPKEVAFIFRHSDSRHLILENVEQLLSLLSVFEAADWERCASVIVVDGSDPGDLPELLRGKTRFYAQVIERGKEAFARDGGLAERLAKTVKGDDLLTIVYTSGTTGNPKGVMLTHANFLQNVYANTPRLRIDEAACETTVVMLPSWHVYERAFEYCALTKGVTVVYSSAGRFAADLLAERPQVLITVPRVWESVYQKLIKGISELPGTKRSLVVFFIALNKSWMTAALRLKGCYVSLRKRPPLAKALGYLGSLALVIALWPGHRLAGLLFKPFREKVGGRLRVATSGAGSLPKYLDEMFNTIGITIVNAYGMTECAPGILSRTIDRNTLGSTGIPFDNTEV
ncbi:MAG: AMP-binding protein, partial [Spirochaetota bacterium]